MANIQKLIEAMTVLANHSENKMKGKGLHGG
jgi:hypothetical protein